MTYRKDIDVMKGIAIIAVVFYHMGILKSGYLGVDLFFVINGYLIVPSLVNKICSDSFSYIDFLKKRFFRLIPLILIASIVCFIVGFWGMLPNDFENLCESIFATNFFSENILSAITTKDYWDVVNDFKPLMHLWYIGILAEFYLVFPILLILANKVFAKFNVNRNKSLWSFVIACFVCSIILYLVTDNDCYKFYYLPYRLFELLFCGVIYYFQNICLERKKTNYSKIIYYVAFCGLVFFIFSSLCLFDINYIGTVDLPVGGQELVIPSGLICSKDILLITVVILSGFVVSFGNDQIFINSGNVLSVVGKRSYSIYIWHQIILAFYRYFLSTEISIPFIAGYILAIIIISEISYRYIEKRVHFSSRNINFSIIGLAVISMVSFFIYLRAGVVRDVPELYIYKNDVHRGMHAEYCDRIYKYDKDFEKNGKKNVLVVGVSFGRDFGNILLESEYKDLINLSYGYKWDRDSINLSRRIKEADIIFSFSSKREIPRYVWNNIKANAKVYGLGSKNFGKSNGIIYSKRYMKDYFSQTVPLDDNYKKLNELWASEWGENYVDFIKPAEITSGRIRVFTPDHKMISQDCRHLSKGGAEWYAKILDLKTLLDL